MKSEGTEKSWSVFVGGTEVNDFLMSLTDAERLAGEYVDDGYDDVALYQYKTREVVIIG